MVSGTVGGEKDNMGSKISSLEALKWLRFSEWLKLVFDL
jgi:hypothetical protein